MPYLNLRLSLPEAPESAEKIVALLIKHTSEALGKKAEVTSIDIDFIESDKWFIGGFRVAAQDAATFYLDVKVT